MRFPVLIDLRRSVRSSLLVVVSHSIALGATIVLPFVWQFRSILAVTIVYSAWWAIRAPAIVGLRILTSDKLEVVARDGSCAPLVVSEQSVVYPRVIVLRGELESESKAASFVVFSDQMPERQFHRLRLWLRCQTATTKDVGRVVS